MEEEDESGGPNPKPRVEIICARDERHEHRDRPNKRKYSPIFAIDRVSW